MAATLRRFGLAESSPPPADDLSATHRDQDPMIYATYLPSLLRGPLAGAWGSRWFGAVGALLDGTLGGGLDAGTLVGPLGAPDDALPMLGADRAIGRLAGETNAGHRARIVAAWETWSRAGTTRGIHTAVRLFGWRGVRSVPHREWPIDATTRWSRYRVYVTGWTVSDEVTSGAATSGLYLGVGVDVRPLYSGDPACISGEVVSGTVCSPDVVEALRASLRQWSNARDACESVVLTWGSAISGAVRSGYTFSGGVAVAWRGSPNFA